MVLIFLNVKSPLIILFILVSLVGCARKEVSKEEFGNQKAVEKKLNAGPLKPTNVFFKNQAQAWGLNNMKSIRHYAVDWDHDGDTDLVTLDSYYGVPKFFRFNSKKEEFIPVMKSPIKGYLRSSFLAFYDFDRDKILDMISVTLNQKTELSPQKISLYKGLKTKNGIEFELVSNAFNIEPKPSSSIGIFDYNLDGLLDIYLGNWYRVKNGKPVAIPDQLFLGHHKGHYFINVSDQLVGFADKKRGKFINARPTYGVSSCDIDQNGFPDILTASSSGHNNRLLLNLTKDKDPVERMLKDYGEMSDSAADKERGYSKHHGGNSFYLNCADYNNDGFMDIAVGELFNAYDDESRDRSSILTGSKNFPPKFLRTEYHKDDGSGRWGQGDRRSLWKDLNHDGLLDLVVENSGIPPFTRLIYFEQENNHAFVDLAESKGVDFLNPSGVISIDVNKDGRLDLISGQIKLRDSRIQPKVYALENKQAIEGRVLRIVLRGKKANYHGLGSMIIMETNKNIYRRYVEYSRGAIPSQNEEGMNFALSKGERIKSLKVRWPWLVKPKKGRAHPLSVKYNVNRFKLGKFNQYILTDGGQIKLLNK